MRNCLSLVLVVAVAVGALPGDGRAQRDDIAARGAWEYQESCAVCHGPSGTGDGAMAAILKVPPPDLTTLSERNGGVFPFERVFRVIDGRDPVEGHGSVDMPVWGRTFRREAENRGAPLFGGDPNLVVAGRIYALAEYLRAIQGGKTVAPMPPSRPRRSWPDDIPVWPKRN